MPSSSKVTTTKSYDYQKLRLPKATAMRQAHDKPPCARPSGHRKSQSSEEPVIGNPHTACRAAPREASSAERAGRSLGLRSLGPRSLGPRSLGPRSPGPERLLAHRQGGGKAVGTGFWPGVRACGEALFEKTSLHFSGLSQGEVNAPVSLSDDPFVLTGRPITPAGRIGPTSAGAAQKRVCVWADSPLNFLTCSRGGRASAQVKRAAARPILSGQVFRKL